MNKGKSNPQGGSPPYEPKKDDLALAEKLAHEGLSLKDIASALSISERTLYNLKNQNEEFLHTIKRGRALEFIEMNQAVKRNEVSPTTYIYFSKTKWKNFYPQETKEIEQPKTNTVEMTEELALKLMDVVANHHESNKENQNQQKAI